ncbi:MAG: AMP-binding protein [Candidatus Cryptobacteroides sp.]
MKHYLKKLEETTNRHWGKLSLCNIDGECFTYGEVAKKIEELHLLFEILGVAKGDKVAICAGNSARWAVSFWAVNTYEAVAVPILADFPPETLQMLINHSDSVLLFTDKSVWESLDSSAMPSLKAAVNVKDFSLLHCSDPEADCGTEHISDLFNARFPAGFKAGDAHYPDGNEDALAIINYTSGTTSDPKGVMLTYGALSDTDEFSNVHFPNTPEDSIVSMLPLAHMYGLAIEFIHPNVDGVTVWFLGKTPTPAKLLKAMSQVRPYMVITVPLVMEKIYFKSIKPVLEKPAVKTLLRVPGLGKLVYSIVRKKVNASFGGKVRMYIMGGAALNPEVEKCFHDIRLQYMVGYGMTEACPLLGWETWEKFVPGSCGKAVHEMRIDSSDPATVPGEIQVRGANMTIGYYKNPAATAAAFTPDGWFRTGDIGLMDADGNIFIRGRAKSMILTASGQNIYPEEIEKLLSDLPDVEESLVVERKGRVVALVYPALCGRIPDRVFASEIQDAVNRHLPAYSRISKVEFVDEPFEKTPKMSIRRYLYT